jgi:hypothetical protein
VTPLFLLMLANGEPADPAVFVDDGIEREVGDGFAARDGSRWRIVSVEAPSAELAAEEFVATYEGGSPAMLSIPTAGGYPSYHRRDCLRGFDVERFPPAGQSRLSACDGPR